MTEDIFRVEWDTGCIETLVGTFFVEASVPRIKKLFKLARGHCTQVQRDDLIRALIRAYNERKKLLDALGELAYKKSDLANQFFRLQCMPEQGWAEKRAIREQAKFQKAIVMLKAEVWGT